MCAATEDHTYEYQFNQWTRIKVRNGVVVSISTNHNDRGKDRKRKRKADSQYDSRVESYLWQKIKATVDKI